LDESRNRSGALRGHILLCPTPTLPLSLYYLIYIKIYKKNAGEGGQRGNEGRRTVKIISGISGHTIFGKSK
jgi:hypothetical protein